MPKSWAPKGDLQIMIRPDDQMATPGDLAKSIEIDLDDYSDMQFTPEQETRIKKKLVNYRTGATAAIPLQCTGDACPFKTRCMFHLEKMAPVGKACLIEINLINGWRTQYIQEYKIDPNSFTELSMISELVEIELLLYRINSNLAQPRNASLTINQTVGVAGDGTPITRIELTPLFDARDRLNNRKTKLVKLMVGDRQEKYKEQAALKRVNSDDPSQQSAELRRQLEHLMRKAQLVDSELRKTEAIDTTVVEGPPEKPSEQAELEPEDILIPEGGE